MAVAATYFHIYHRFYLSLQYLSNTLPYHFTLPFHRIYCPYCRPLMRNICRPCTSRGNKWEPNVHKSYTLVVYVQHPLTH